MLKVTNLSKSFNKNTDNEIDVFNQFNLEIKKNKSTAIIGPNGCGKSTLLNMIGGSILSDTGEILLNNKNIAYLEGERRSFYICGIYQDPSMRVFPILTILDTIALAFKRD